MKKALRSRYYAIFKPYLCYASIVWVQNTNSVKRLHLLQKNSLKIMLFQSQNSHTNLQSFGGTAFENCIFISTSSENQRGYCHLSSKAGTYFKSQIHGTSCTNLGYLKIYCFYKCNIFGRYAMIVKAIYIWSHLQRCHQNVIFHQFRANKLKEILITFFLNRYK